MGINLDKLMEEWKKKRSIICPHCEHIHDPSIDYEILEGLITYHGEDDPVEFTCYHCDKAFFVKEHVERVFEVKKTMKEFDL